jgi:hypothetical protein
VTPFFATANNYATTTPGYSAGASSLALAAGAGAALAAALPAGAPSPGRPVLVSTFVAGVPRWIASFAGRAGDVLTGRALLAGADADLPPGAAVEIRWTAQHAEQVAQAILQAEAALDGLAAGLAAHESAPDPHPVYLTPARGDGRYDPAGSAVEVAADLAAHAAADDPHPQYLTPAEADAAYQPIGGGGSSLPVPDATPLVAGSADPTKLLRFEVDGIAAGATRVLTPPDQDGTLAILERAQTWTAQQVHLCGAAGASPLVVRQTGGAPGTDEVQVSHNGTRGLVESKDGTIDFKVPAATAGNFRVDGISGTPRLTSSGGSGVGARLRLDGVLAAIDASTGWQVDASGTFMPFTSTFQIVWNGDTGLVRASAGVLGLTNGGSGRATLRSLPLTPAQITANQNDYAPGVARFYRLSADAPRSITGLSVAQVDGQECEFWNVGTQPITLAHQHAGSAAGNRFLCTGAADLTLAADEVALLRYDSTSQRWRARKV